MVVYLHGLNSSSRSHKAAVLRGALAPVRLLAPDYPAHRPDAAVAVLSDFLSELAEQSPAPVVVGSSMGAFYGQYLARRFPVRHLYMINPALKPWELLPAYVDTPMTTAGGEEYRLTRAVIEATRAYGIDDPCDAAVVPTTLFLDQGDEVIDYRVAEAMYRDCGRVLIYPGGDHGFAHLEQAIAVIRTSLPSGAEGAR